MELIHLILTLLLLITAVSIFTSNNPVYSVLYLILCFCIASIIVLMFEVEFLGLLFIMVYVGAVSVLFLFVVMMINTKIIMVKNFEIALPFIVLLGAITFLKIRFFIFDSFFDESSSNVIKNKFNSSILLIDNLTNTELIGQVLFNNYNIAVLIAGFVLLIALIGSIILTISFKESKKMDESYEQLGKADAKAKKLQ